MRNFNWSVIIVGMLGAILLTLFLPVLTESAEWARGHVETSAVTNWLDENDYVAYGSSPGLTAGQVPYATGANSLTSEAGFEYNAATNTFSVLNITAPTGRTTTYFIAASDATAQEIAQADFVCDGVDDQAQINAAYTAGGAYTKVFTSSGNFYTSAAIVMDADGLVLEGMGASSTIINLANNSDCNIIELGANTSANRKQPTVKNLGIAGNKNNQASGNGIVDYSYWTILDTVSISSVKEYGVLLGTPASGTQPGHYYTDVRIFYCGTGGFNLADGSDFVLTNCEVGEGDYGILCSSSGLKVSKGHFWTIATAAIMMSNCQNFKIDNCEFENLGINAHGILISATSSWVYYFTISNNTFWRNNVTTGTGDCIKFANGGGNTISRFTIEGNVFHHYNYTVNLGGTFTQNGIITGNNFYSALSGNVTGSISTTLVMNNNWRYIAPGEVKAYSQSVVDDGPITLETGRAGFGTVIFGDSVEYSEFYFTAAGVVTLVDNTANVVNTDTDTKYCVYDAGTGVAVRNRSGGTLTVTVQVTYQ